MGSNKQFSKLINICKKLLDVKFSAVHLSGQYLANNLIKITNNELPADIINNGNDLIVRVTL
jgi:hypothetical protein